VSDDLFIAELEERTHQQDHPELFQVWQRPILQHPTWPGTGLNALAQSSILTPSMCAIRSESLTRSRVPLVAAGGYESEVIAPVGPALLAKALRMASRILPNLWGAWPKPTIGSRVQKHDPV
jgi:hypothetical protein